MIPIVVWAHIILGLTVVIRSPLHEDLVFGTLSPSMPAQVIINWRADAADESNADDSEILLLDRMMKVVLKTLPDQVMGSDITTQERHNLQSFGSLLMYRWFNEASTISDDSPIYQDLIEYVLAVVIVRSRKIGHQSTVNFFEAQKQHSYDFSWYSLEYWRISSAGSMLFHRQISKLDDRQRKESMLRVEKLAQTFQHKILEGLPLPRSLELYVDKLQEPDRKAIGINPLISRLTTLVFVA